jgi:energy-coupling factor transporter transmembrane protein EcfT
MTDSSRTQGGLICVGVAIAAAFFLLGLLQKSYWALAIPVALLVFFTLGLVFWVGYTIATVQVEPFEPGEPAPGEPPTEPPSDRPA